MLQKFFKTLDKNTLIIIGTGVIATICFVIYVTLKNISPSMGLLFSQIDPSDSNKIIDCLKQMSVSFDTKDNGSQILVPEKKIAEIRMVLAEKGLPSGSVVGYELFDKKDFFGTSSNIIDVNYARALEGELSRSIKTINQIHSARVHLVFPRRGLFTVENEKPSASIMIKMIKNEKLNQGQIAAIRHLAASAVPNLNVDSIAIIDDDGTLLAKGQDESESTSVTFQQDIRHGYENHLSNTIESLLEKSLGEGKIKAKVTAELDFDKVSTTSIKYDPDGKVERNIQTNEESDAKQNEGAKTVSVQSSLPNQQNQENTSQNQMKNNQETINYEISNTQKTYVKEGWTVKRLSVAVVIDGYYTFDKKKKKNIYHKRSKEEINQITEIVKTSIGYDKNRGDNVRILNIPFKIEEKKETPSVIEKLLDPNSNESLSEVARKLFIDFLKFLSFIFFQESFMTLVGVALSFIYFIKPMIIKLFEPVKGGEELAKSTKKISEIINNNAEYDENGVLIQESQPKASQIDLTDIDSCVEGSSLKKIVDLIQKYPNEAVGILRSWVYLDKK